MADAQTIKEKIKANGNVEKPIHEIHKKIDESNEHILVLRGIRGSGRTTVLLEKEAKSDIGKEINIYHHFEHAGFGVTSKDVGIDFIKHRFELEMASVFLRYIISKGILDKRTEIISEELKELRKLFVYDINMLGVNGSFKSNIVQPGHYTEYLAKEIKSIYYPEKFSLLVDRFDWMFNRSVEAQECIRDYFPLFDQVVLTTDDETYSSKYPTIEVNYGKDKDTVKEIISQYVKTTNDSKNIEERLDLSYISEETIDYIVEKANGDIEVILRAIKSLYSYFDCYPEEELNGALKMEMQDQVNKRQKIKQPEHLRPRFYV